MMNTTENGAASYGTTNDPRLDLFFKTTRNLGKLEASDEDNHQLHTLINASWMVDQQDTMKILMNWRDCRGGKGDYDGFITAMAYINSYVPGGKDWVAAIFALIPEYGSWLDLIKLWHLGCQSLKDDIMEVITSQLQKDIVTMRIIALTNETYVEAPVSLLAKWIPSENSKWDRYTKNRFCLALCKALFPSVETITSKELRSLRQDYLSPIRKHLDLVEIKMCRNVYGEIDYSKVPSVAMNRYKDAFKDHDKERFTQYLADVAAKKTKINSGQVYPHDLVKQYLESDLDHNDVIEAQWQDIKAKVAATGAFKNAISIVDVSGSMHGTPIQVAIALGLLSCGEWNDHQVITFSDDPALYSIKEFTTLHDQVKRTSMDMPWEMNTNFEKVIDLIHGLVMDGKKQIDRLFIFSDMQFDQAITDSNQTDMERIKAKFATTGHTLPQIIFWNLRGDTQDFPITTDESGVAMLSGFSPALLTSIMDNDDISPMAILFKIIRSPRYEKIKLPHWLQLDRYFETVV